MIKGRRRIAPRIRKKLRRLGGVGGAVAATTRQLLDSSGASASGLRVAMVADDFTRACFAPEADTLPLHADIWRAQLAAFRPDLVFVESAWRGPHESWRRQIARYEDVAPSEKLGELLAFCRGQDIPSVFWNKEDPVHFDRFIEAASGFDYVYTTEEAIQQRYVDATSLDADRVGCLMFAAQPKLHHPADAIRAPSVCFAGSYGEEAFVERRQQVEYLLDAAHPYSLLIYDRNLPNGDPRQRFPGRFEDALRPGIPYAELVDEYRRHRVFLNVNSVSRSMTMFSRRVFELLACGTPVVSTPSLGIEHLFDGIVRCESDQEGASAAIAELMGDPLQWRETSRAGVRRVLNHHTYRHRLHTIASKIGLTTESLETPRPAALGVVESGADLELLGSTLSAQTTRSAEIVVLRDRKSVGPSEASIVDRLRDALALPAGKVIVCDARSADPVAACRAAASRVEAADIVPFSREFSYGPGYLESLVICREFSRAEMIGKAALSPGDGDSLAPEHSHDVPLNPHGIMMRRAVMAAKGWDWRSTGTSSLLRAYRGLSTYATDSGDFESGGREVR